MDLNYTPEEQAFRAEVRAFVTGHLPADISAKVKHGKRLHKDDFVRWQQVLRVVLLVFAVGFAGLVYTTIRQRTPAPDGATRVVSPNGTPTDIRTNARGFRGPEWPAPASGERPVAAPVLVLLYRREGA